MSAVKAFFAARRNGLHDFAAVQVALAAWRTSVFQGGPMNIQIVDEPPLSLQRRFQEARITKAEALVLRALAEVCDTAAEMFEQLELAGNKVLKRKLEALAQNTQPTV